MKNEKFWAFDKTWPIEDKFTIFIFISEKKKDILDAYIKFKIKLFHLT
jgi:hypothetical protein